jgi:DNA-binding protein YbaB
MLMTDREIISEYRGLTLQLGITLELQKAIERLLVDICPTRQSLWQKIFEGIKRIWQGDGYKFDGEFETLRYDNTEAYTEAYNIFNEIIKEVPDKESLLYIFVEDCRLVALGLSRTIDLIEILSLYDVFLQKFIDNMDESIEVEVAGALLDKSFILSQLDKTKINEKETIENFIITKFGGHTNSSIKETVLIVLSNNAITYKEKYEKIYEENKKKELELKERIINSYKENDANNVKVQVARAMFLRAFDLHEEFIINKARRENGFYLPEEGQIDYDIEAKAAYIAVIERFNDNNFIRINEYVGFAKSGLIQLALCQENDIETIRLCEEFITDYKEISGKPHPFWLGEALKALAELYEKQEEYQKALAVYDQSIEKFADHKSFNFFAGIAEGAKSELEGYLHKVNNVDFNFEDFQLKEKTSSMEGLQDVLAKAQLDEMKVTGNSTDNAVVITLSGKYDVIGIEVSNNFNNLSKEELEGAISSALQNAKIQVDDVLDKIINKELLLNG